MTTDPLSRHRQDFTNAARNFVYIDGATSVLMRGHRMAIVRNALNRFITEDRIVNNPISAGPSRFILSLYRAFEHRLLGQIEVFHYVTILDLREVREEIPHGLERVRCHEHHQLVDICSDFTNR